MTSSASATPPVDETPVLADLRWRGLVQDSTDPVALSATLSAGPVTFYCGFDPTAPSLHVGHLLQVLTMRRLQRAGHRPLVLVGGATGLIGDPKPTAERSLVDEATTAGWALRLRAQLEPFFEFEGPSAARLVDNLEWTAGLSTIAFLRDVGKHFSVNRMLDRDAVARRLASASGISYTEFSYVLLQSNDFLELRRRFDCRLQIGGSDQWGNISAGVELVRRVDSEQVHAVTTPLLVKSDGTKYGKTEGGTVWLDADLTSAYSFYQYWLNVDDDDVGMLLRRLTFLDREQLLALDDATAQRPAAREAQRALAGEVTALVHGQDAVREARDASAALFGGGDLAELPPAVLDAALRTVPHATPARAERLPSYADLAVLVGLAPSKTVARRTAADGGLYVNNEKVVDADTSVDLARRLHGRWLVLRRGRRTVAGIDAAALD
jgi:tyrosyl-tRNA synthetase